jgi:hypothetical protein
VLFSNSFLSSTPKNDSVESKAMPNTTEQNDVIEPSVAPSQAVPKPTTPSLATLAPLDLALNAKPTVVEPPVVLKDLGTETPEPAHSIVDTNVDELKSKNQESMSDEKDEDLVKPTILPTHVSDENVEIVDGDKESGSDEEKQNNGKDTEDHVEATRTETLPTKVVKPTHATDRNVDKVDAKNEAEGNEEKQNKEKDIDDHVYATPTDSSASHQSDQIDNILGESSIEEHMASANEVPTLEPTFHESDNVILKESNVKDQLQDTTESDLQNELQDKQSAEKENPANKKADDFIKLEMLPIPKKNAGSRNAVAKAKPAKKVDHQSTDKSNVVTATSSKRHDMGLGETKDDEFPRDPAQSKDMAKDLAALHEKPQKDTSNAVPVQVVENDKSSEHHDVLTSAIDQAEQEADKTAGSHVQLPGAESHDHESEGIDSLDNSSPSNMLEKEGMSLQEPGATSSQEQTAADHDAPSTIHTKFDTSPIRSRRPIRLTQRVCPPCRKY